MALTIDSTRFGPVEVDAESVIDFPDGLIGLGGRRFVLLARDPGSPLVWLHCVDDPSLALPVANPHQFFADFVVEMSDEDAAHYGLDDATLVEVFVTVRAAEAIEDFTANLRAPILIWSGQGIQIINQVAGCPLRAALFAEALSEDTAARPSW